MFKHGNVFVQLETCLKLFQRSMIYHLLTDLYSSTNLIPFLSFQLDKTVHKMKSDDLKSIAL